MKKVFSMIAIFAAISSNGFSQGKAPSSDKATTRDSIFFSALQDTPGVLLNVQKGANSKTRVTLYDAAHQEILVYQLPAKPAIKQRYVMGDPGTYYFVVESSSNRFEQKVIIAIRDEQKVDVRL